jgi:hypothetical protein
MTMINGVVMNKIYDGRQWSNWGGLMMQQETKNLLLVLRL